MNRIIGLVSKDHARDSASATARMAESIGLNSGWMSRVESIGPARFGAYSQARPALFISDHLLVVIDGSIYNRRELGEAQSDAELFTSLYLHHGFENAVAQLNGDFAIALFDMRSGELWLARDRFGVKPLYYVSTPELFAFASRPRSLLGLPGVTKKVNSRFVATFAASHYRYFDNDPQASPFEKISQLPAAHVLRLSDGQLTETAYWQLEDLPDFTEPEEGLADEYRDLLLDAVSLRLASAVRPAFTLSGGMDSSSVLASAVRLTGLKQHAFSTVYADKTYDESDEIRSMLGAAVEQWHPIAISTPDVFGLVRHMIDVHDEPVATATWLSHFLLCREASQSGFGSLFGGLGGDELNAGEYDHFLYFFADLRAEGDEQRLENEVRWWAHYHDHPIFRKSFEVVEEGFSRLIDFTRPGRFLPDHTRLRRYHSALNRDYFDLSSFDPATEHTFSSYLKNRTCQDIFRETIPCCLRAEDRQTAAAGLDNFAPFFDHRLVEFMFRVSGRLKYRDGVTKRLLREAMRGVLPEETRTRVKKTGWNAPAHVWFTGKGRDDLLDMARSQSFRERGIYNVEEVVRLIDEHNQIIESGRMVENHMMFLWQLVNLELWLSALSEW